MITVHTTHRYTGKQDESLFKTELGAFQHVQSTIMDNTNLPRTMATDIANLLCDRQFKIRQQRLGPLLFTINRSRA